MHLFGFFGTFGFQEVLLLLLLGVLLIVVGVQLFTIGLVSEMVQRYHLRPQDEEARSRVERVIR